MNMIGVPASSRKRVQDRYTVPGAIATAPSRDAYETALSQANAIAAMETGIDRYTADASQNTYHQQIGIDLYDVAGPGLGDLEGEGTNTWADVAKNFVSSLGSGLATGISKKIGGQAPAPVTQVYAAPEKPKWLPVALIGGAAVLGVVLVMSLRKKR